MGLIARYRKLVEKDGWPSRLWLDMVTVVVLAIAVWQWTAGRLSNGQLGILVAGLVVLHIIRMFVMKQTDEQRKKAVSSPRFMLDILTLTMILVILWNWFKDGASMNSSLVLVGILLILHIIKLIWQVWRYPRLTPTEQEFYRNSVSLLDYRPREESTPE